MLITKQIFIMLKLYLAIPPAIFKISHGLEKGGAYKKSIIANSSIFIFAQIAVAKLLVLNAAPFPPAICPPNKIRVSA